jgi:threonine dehydratase
MARAEAVTTPELPVTLADIRAAHDVVRAAIVPTPCLHSRTLSELTGAQVWLKFENLQFTASFKERGALNRLTALTAEQRRRGVIAMSAGNHAQGVAFHAQRLGIPATIVMPQGTPLVKVRQTEGHNATVILHGEKLEDSAAHARAISNDRGLTFVHPYDDPLVIAGQGTIAIESVAARALNPNIEIIGVQAELYPSMAAKLKGFEAICDGDSLAEGIAVKYPGDLTYQIVKALVHDILLVSETDLESAVSLLITIEKTVAEGAGAAGLAAMLARPERFRGKNVGLVVCGGNIDTRLLAGVLVRELAREGRIARLRVRMKDRPGQLLQVAQVFADMGANIIDVSHQRIFTKIPAKGTYADIEVETRDRRHLDRLIEALRDKGFDVRLVEAV